MAPPDGDGREFRVELPDAIRPPDRDEGSFVDALLDDGRDDRSADRACRPTESGPEGWAFTILMILPLPVIVALMIGTGVPPSRILLLAAVIVIVPVISLWLVVRLLWEPYRRRFPALHPTERVRWKRLQIVRLGLLGGFNHCVDVGADDRHVHLSLMMPLRLFARPMSIPRDEIEWGGRERPRSIFGMARVRVAGKRCWLPAWVFADAA